VTTTPISSVSCDCFLPHALSSPLCARVHGSGESLGQKHQSKDDDQRSFQMMSSSRSENSSGGEGGAFHNLWILINLLPLISFSPLGDTMKISLLFIVSMICLSLPNPQQYAQGQLSEKQYQCLHTLWTKESNWRSNAKSATHDMGIPQRHMKHNTKAQQEKFLSDPLAQVDWGLGYIEHRYNTPCRALAAWMSRADHRGVGGWY